jgi:uncharacterized protein (TIGR02996 family)
MTWPPRVEEPVDPHIRAFLDDIADHPKDPGRRLIFADWLQEHHDPRAELLRLQAEQLKRDDRRKDVEERTKAWLAAHGREWLGELPPPSGGYSLCLQYDLLEVMGYLAPVFLEGPRLEGLRQALREGWVRSLRLTFWQHGQIVWAAHQGLLSGPTDLDWLGGSFTDDSLALLAARTQLQRVHIGGSRATVTDLGLAHLGGLVRLRELSLWSLGRLTGEGLAHLSGLKRLRQLSLYNCEHVGEMRVHLGLFPGLKELSLNKCGEVSDASLAHLAGRTGLRSLSLSDSQRLSDAGLAHLSGLPGLVDLSLANCPGISNAGLANLAGLQNLRRLNLYNCKQLTGAGIVHLHGLKALKFLNLRGCKLRPHETRALRKALPGCEVAR